MSDRIPSTPAAAAAAAAGAPGGAGYRGRLAPSPTGALHLGNARTFLAVWLRARQAGGALLLRMEDIDGPRVKAGAAALALDDLRWLGLDWDEGPDRGGPHAPYVQSERVLAYAAATRDLLARGLAYPCVCSRREVEEAASAPHGPDGALYPGTCRARFGRGPSALGDAERAAGRPAAVRVDVLRLAEQIGASTVDLRDGFAGPRRFEVAALGDFVIEKGDRGPSYQLACVLDDASMGVTEVVRGDDLLPSAARQVLLYRALGFEPPAFIHLPLVVGPDGRRLAKRHGDTRVRALREAGVPAERLVALLAGWLGIDLGDRREAAPRDLVGRFEVTRVPREPLVSSAVALAGALGLGPGRLAPEGPAEAADAARRGSSR